MNVFLTGGTGTFGQAFTRYVLDKKIAERVVVFSRDEWKQAEMAKAFQHDIRIRFMLGDVRDVERLEQAMQTCDTVVHAAALKRVDSIAYNPGEVLKTNVQGTANVCIAAVKADVRKVIFLSSDKAVMPQNVYGVSKAMAEHITIGANVYGFPQGTAYAAVRYGNVLGSRGSVVHIWRDAVAAGKPIVLTHEDMTRFWMTPEQAVLHVLRSHDRMLGGEIFLPNLRAASLLSLALAIGGEGYPMKITGLRPGGEKLHERMVSDEEPLRTFDNNMLYTITPQPCSWTEPLWGGKPMCNGWTYSSEDAEKYSVEELKVMLKEVV